MGKKTKEILGKNVRKSLISAPKQFVQEISTDYPNFEFTRAVDTCVMEKIKETPLKIDIKRDGRSLLSSNLLWISRETDGHVTMYLENKKYLYPTADSVKGAFFYPPGKTGGGNVEIELQPNAPSCAICSKPMEIFDEVTACPSCGSQSHVVHIQEYIRMRGECNVCNAKLSISAADGSIIMA
nr:hypothetical protein [Candidatus Sigynarchaeota archaeon]